jgi:hypothetical protein
VRLPGYAHPTNQGLQTARDIEAKDLGLQCLWARREDLERAPDSYRDGRVLVRNWGLPPEQVRSLLQTGQTSVPESLIRARR